MTTPLIYTPISKAQLGWMTNQIGPCSDFEMDMYRCGSRVGNFRVGVDCKKELDDFRECLHQKKQFKRYVIMQNERSKQKRPFTEAPPQDVAGIIN